MLQPPRGRRTAKESNQQTSDEDATRLISPFLVLTLLLHPDNPVISMSLKIVDQREKLYEFADGPWVKFYDLL